MAKKEIIRHRRFFMLFCKSCFQSGFLVLITRLAQQGEHILFIALYARLVKGIDAHQIAGNSAGLFKGRIMEYSLYDK